MARARSLLDLPGEIRNRIYHEVLVQGKPFDIFKYDRFGSERSLLNIQRAFQQPGLTRSCKRIREESLPIFYGLNSFIGCVDPEEMPCHYADIYDDCGVQTYLYGRQVHPTCVATVLWLQALGRENRRLLANFSVRIIGETTMDEVCREDTFEYVSRYLACGRIAVEHIEPERYGIAKVWFRQLTHQVDWQETLEESVEMRLTWW